MAKKRKIVPGGVDAYIKKCPANVQANLKKIRSAIRSVVPDATETLSYFHFPGYHYDGDYAYNGMFVWFSYKAPYIRLHVYPQVIKNNAKALEQFPKGAAVISFPQETKIPAVLIRKLVRQSLTVMRDDSKAEA